MIAKILIAHLIGDYLLQTHHMAVEKTSRWLPAILHGVVYTIPFLFLTQNIWALLIISMTHIVIDRYRLAKHYSWFKNQFGPKRTRFSWDEAKDNAGYSKDTPAWLSTWLMILTDNIIHVIINIVAITMFR